MWSKLAYAVIYAAAALLLANAFAALDLLWFGWSYTTTLVTFLVVNLAWVVFREEYNKEK